MTITKCYCDNCKKEITNDFDQSWRGAKRILVPVYSTKNISRGHSLDFKEMDLCYDCLKKLAERVVTLCLDQYEEDDDGERT